MKHKRKKDKDVKRHFIKRFRQRFGIIIDENKYNQILGQIRRGDSKIILSQSLSRKIHKISLEGEEYLVVYNPIKKVLHTVLPVWATGKDIPKSKDVFRSDLIVSISGISY